MSKLPEKIPRKTGENVRTYKGETRLNLTEKTVLIQKANLFNDGDESKFVREAILNYKPIKKVEMT